MRTRLGTAFVVFGLVGLAACGGADDPAPNTSTNTESTPGKRIALADLPEGPLPRLDVTLGSTLIHDGREIEPHGWGTKPYYISAMGTYDDRPIVDVTMRGGNQFFTVEDDGTTKPLGSPYSSYNYPSRLVVESGHLLTFFSNRETGQLTVTVVDASTGDNLAVLDKGDDLSVLEPADRAVLEVLMGAVRPRPRLEAVSPDGSVEVTIRSGSDLPATLVVSPAGGTDDGMILAFAGEADQVVFESNDAFLVAIAERDDISQPIIDVLVRCTVDGDCERTTEPSVDVTVAGAFGVHFGPR